MENFLDVSVYVVIYFFVIVIGIVAYRYLDIVKKKLVDEVSAKQLMYVESLAYTVVAAAEQIFGIEGDNEEKLSYVLNVVHERYPAVDISITRAIIEGMVAQYKEFRKEVIQEVKQ